MTASSPTGDTAPGPRMNAPFREVIHNIHQFGEHWSWRCGVQWTRASEGWKSGACRYDHIVDSWDQLVADATEHLAKWHDIHPAPAVSSSSPDDTALGDPLVEQLRWELEEARAALRGQNERVFKENERLRVAAACAAVPDTAPAPGVDRIAQAIETACEVGDMDVEVFQDGSARLDPYRLLAKVLDKAGLIDWSAFTEPVTADGDEPSSSSPDDTAPAIKVTSDRERCSCTADACLASCVICGQVSLEGGCPAEPVPADGDTEETR
jgi:hypothetical protein